MTTTIGGLAKRMAQTATPAISPTTVSGDKEFFVMFCNSNAFRDLKKDSVLTQANREARPRNVKSNPIFVDGAEVHNGVTYIEIPEIPSLGLVGASSEQVGVNFFCGVQAIGIAFAKRATPIMNNTDYNFRKGVGIMENRGVKKLLFEDPGNVGTDVQHGIVTVYTAAVDDA